jgi:hypothetical protein
MIYGLARLLSVCQQGLEGFPESLVGLRVVLQGLRVLWVLLLLESVLHGSLGLMLASVIGMTACTLLLRLLGVLVQPHLHRSLTDASELQRQLQLLVSCICRSLPLPHSRLLLTFDDPCLEEQYTQVRQEHTLRELCCLCTVDLERAHAFLQLTGTRLGHHAHTLWEGVENPTRHV